MKTPCEIPVTEKKKRKKYCRIEGNLKIPSEYLKIIRTHRKQKNMWPEKQRSPQLFYNVDIENRVKTSLIEVGLGSEISSIFPKQ